MMPLDLNASVSSSSGAQGGTAATGAFDFGGGKKDMTFIIVGGVVVLLGFVAWLITRK